MSQTRLSAYGTLRVGDWVRFDSLGRISGKKQTVCETIIHSGVLPASISNSCVGKTYQSVTFV